MGILALSFHRVVKVSGDNRFAYDFNTVTECVFWSTCLASAMPLLSACCPPVLPTLPCSSDVLGLTLLLLEWRLHVIMSGVWMLRHESQESPGDAQGWVLTSLSSEQETMLLSGHIHGGLRRLRQAVSPGPRAMFHLSPLQVSYLALDQVSGSSSLVFMGRKYQRWKQPTLLLWSYRWRIRGLRKSTLYQQLMQRPDTDPSQSSLIHFVLLGISKHVRATTC